MKYTFAFISLVFLAASNNCPNPNPSPSPSPSPTITPSPSPTPTPTPLPTPTPTPEPNPSNPPFPWKNTNTPPAENCGKFESDYLAVMDEVFGTGVNAAKPNPGESLVDFYTRMSPELWKRDVGTAIYGEEIAVQQGKGFSENFDRVTSAGEPRWGPGSYRSSCSPASYSQLIGNTVPPTPSPTPTPGPTPTPEPTPPPNNCQPFNPKDCPELKSINARIFSQVGRCTKLLDATPSQDVPPRHRPLGPECGDDACCKQINQRGVCEDKYGPYTWIFADPVTVTGCNPPGMNLVPNPLQVKARPTATFWVKAKNGVESNRLRVTP